MQVSQYRNDLNTIRRNFESAKARAEKHILLYQTPGSGKVKGANERLLRFVVWLVCLYAIVMNPVRIIND